MASSWIHKYRPKSFKDIAGHAEQIKELRQFVQSYRQQKRKAVLLTGMSGSGKTAIVHALANELGLELVEINASDVRNKESIVQIIGSASRQMSLFSKGKLILVDEVDGLSGTEDRGGIPALLTVIESTSFPIIMTARTVDDDKVSPLKKAALCIQLSELSYTSVFEVLKRICTEESIKFDESALKTLARRNGGDVRAAINDLQSLAQDKKAIGQQDLEGLPEREQLQGISHALMKIFKPTGHEIALTALNNISEDLDEVMMWVDENLPKEYTKPEDLARAYDALSRADVHRGRIMRWQHWRFMVYADAMLTAGVASAKTAKNREIVEYIRPKRPLKIWIANQRFQKRKQIAKKIALATHTSQKRALQDTFPYVYYIFRKGGKNSMLTQQAISEELELDKDELEWLRK
jgi:replication factor C large subunit